VADSGAEPDVHSRVEEALAECGVDRVSDRTPLSGSILFVR
jgi:hypothetical protein